MTTELQVCMYHWALGLYVIQPWNDKMNGSTVKILLNSTPWKPLNHELQHSLESLYILFPMQGSSQ